MTSTRFWDAAAGWSLPAIILLAGLLPPHVHQDLASSLCVLGLLLLVALMGAGRLPAPNPGAGAALLVVAGLMGLSTYAALSPLRAARVVSLWLVGGIVFAAARFAPPGSVPRRVAASVVLLGTVLAVLGLYQAFILFPSTSAEEVASALPELGAGTPAAAAARARVASARAVGTLGLPALLAAILLLGIPLAGGEAAATKGPARLIWLGALVVQAAGMAATRSLGGMAALIAAAAIFAPRWAGSPRGRRVALAAAFALAIVAASAAVGSRAVGYGPGSVRRSLIERVENWKAGVSMILDNPLLGVGPGNFGLALPAYRTAESNETQHAHNTYLEVVSDLGAPAAPFLLLGTIALVRAVRRTARDGGEARARPRGRALAVAAAAWAAQNLVDFGGYVAAVTIPFAAVAGLLTRRATEAAGGPVVARPAAGISTRSLLLASAALAALVAIPDSAGRRHLEAAVHKAAMGEGWAAIESARDATLWSPLDPEAHAFLSQALITEAAGLPLHHGGRRALVIEAILEAEEAVRLEPASANRRAVSARARAAAGDGAGAYADMALAARLNPFRPQYRRERDALQALLTGAAGALGPEPAGRERD